MPFLWGIGAGEGTLAGQSQLAKGRDPKKWPVQHSKGRKGGSRQPRRSRTTLVEDDGNADLCTECGMEGGSCAAATHAQESGMGCA